MDKTKSCKDCPDRSVEPNCHMTCEFYLDRLNKHAEEVHERKKEVEIEGVIKSHRPYRCTAFEYKERRK